MDLVLWKECLPHLLHLICVDFCLFPMLGVPLDIQTTYWTALRPEWVLSAFPSGNRDLVVLEGFFFPLLK